MSYPAYFPNGIRHVYFGLLCLRKYLSVSQDIDGKGIALSKFKGKALLIVNVASQW
jgi:hypothetical protein